MKDKKKDFGSLLSKVKNTAVEPPKQMVVPVKDAPENTKFTFHMPTEKYHKLKILAVNRSSHGKKVYLQELINDALDKAYFNDSAD